MDKREEKKRLEEKLKTVRETKEERYQRVTSGREPKAHVIPDKRNRKPKHKDRDYDER
ncbi:MAG: hypothetical protein IJ215_02790 [Clostridia bacterium]|nr:hypothetical protein [Clostridia bacterium]